MAKFEGLNIQFMKRVFLVAGYLLLVVGSFGQAINQKLQKAFAAFEKDSQLKHAISSLYVIDASSGQIVFDENSQIGLAPASTQKIITSVTAFELLGKHYRYKTQLIFKNNSSGNRIESLLIIKGSGDPTLGSPRYSQSTDSSIIKKWVNSIKKKLDNRI